MAVRLEQLLNVATVEPLALWEADATLAADRFSPIHKADKIVAPLFVIHGANDPRVPIGQAEQIVARLRALGRPVEYLRYENEGHGLAKLANKLDAYPQVADFLERHLTSDLT